MKRLIDADALYGSVVKKVCDDCPYDDDMECDGDDCKAGMMLRMIDDAPTVELVHPCHHKYKTYGAFDVLHHEPTEEEQLEIKKSLAEKLLPALTDELQVCRCHYPAGERVPEDPSESWTYGVKFTVCHECGKPDIEREDKSFAEHGITAMKKALGIAIAEHYVGESGEVIKL